MSWPYSLIKVVATGDLLTAADYNNEHTNHINNNIPSSIDDASATTTDFQTTEAPFPGAGISLPTSLTGEITRLRYQLALLTGTEWYSSTPFGQNIDSLARNNQFHTHQGGTVAVGGGGEFYYNGPTLDGTAAITPATITGASIAANTITGSNFVDGSITTAKLTSNAVTTIKITDANVTAAKLATDALNYRQFQTGHKSTLSGAATQTFSDTGLGRIMYVAATDSGAVGSASVTITVDGVLKSTTTVPAGTTGYVDLDGSYSSASIPLGYDYSSSVSIAISGANTKTISVGYLKA